MSITEETRREAYIRNLPKMIPMARVVLEHIDEIGPSIVEDVMRRMGTGNPNRVAPRVSWLFQNGLVKEVGKRKNSGGFTATIFEITEKGKAALRGANTEDGSMGNNSMNNLPQESGDCQ